MAKHRRTKKQYTELFDNPAALFDSANVTLWPNGEREIWIQGKLGKGFRISASEGPAGLSLHISSFVGAPGMTMTGNRPGDYETFATGEAKHLSLCQYNADEKSQAFKAWYTGDVATRGNPPNLG